MVYDVDPFDDSLVGNDIKQVFERRAATANIFIVAPFLDNASARTALSTGVAVQRAMSYLSPKSGSVFLLETKVGEGDSPSVTVVAAELRWDSAAGHVCFLESKPLDKELRQGWLFDLFDSNEGLVIAPPGVHFRKSSSKHTNKFLRTANTLTSSSACGLVALFALSTIATRQPKRVLVDTAPLISVAYAMMRAAKARKMWEFDVPTRSFSSYGGQRQIGRLSVNDVVLISATTSGSLAKSLVEQRALPSSIVTIFYLGEKNATAPENVLCDLTITPKRGFGYQPVENYLATSCRLCDADFILADLEGDQFLLQQRQHRLLKFVKTTQCKSAGELLTELYESRATEVVLRPDSIEPSLIEISEERLLVCPEIRGDFIRLLRRFIPQPLGLVVLVGMSKGRWESLVAEAGIGYAVPDDVQVAERLELAAQSRLAKGKGALVVFGCLSSQTTARQINASLRSIVDDGNVAYLSMLTLASTPEQYQSLAMFLSYGERGLETFTFRDARRLALPGSSGEPNPWVQELDLLNRLAQHENIPELDYRRSKLSTLPAARDNIFLDGLKAPLAIQRDFVYLDTRGNISAIAQADVFAVVANLFASARSGSRELTKKSTEQDVIQLAQSVYGHVLLDPEAFSTFNDAVLKASLLRAARPSDLMYEIDAAYSARMAEIVLAELVGWPAGNGDALPEMLLSLAAKRLRLRDMDRATIRRKALAADLQPFLRALTTAIEE